MARIIGEVRPTYAFVENSPMLTTRGLGVVLADLASMGFDAEWGVLSAADVGAPHRRERIWILGRNTERKLAHPDMRGRYDGQAEINTAKAKLYALSKLSSSSSDVAYTSKLHGNVSPIHREHGKGEISKFRNGSGAEIRNTNSQDVERQRNITIGIEKKLRNISNASWWSIEPNVGRVANGVAFRVDRLKAIGNGQVPLCASTAFSLLLERFNDGN